MHDVDAHAYDEVRYEEYLERIRAFDDDEESGASPSPRPDTDTPGDAPEHLDEEAA